MGKNRYAAKSDSNQKEIVAALRSIPGVTVTTGMDDILVGRNGRTYWFEIKDPINVSQVTGEIWPSKLKKSQVKLRETWTGQYDIVHSLEQILLIIGVTNEVT